MAKNTLASLASAGIVARKPRSRRLHVTIRSMAHAEGTAGRLRAMQGVASDVDVLQAALATWDEYHGDVRMGAFELATMMAEREQWGIIHPAFPAPVAA